MDRQIVYPGSIPLDTDILSVQRNAMVGLGYLAQATLGPNAVVDGLACQPTAPASLTVSVGAGSIASLNIVDGSPFGSMPAENANPLVKMGINTAPTRFTLTPPSASGQAINYLIQAAFFESDASPVVLPYYNAANPAQPYSGPTNNGDPQNTQRLQRVQLQLKPSAPANAGSQMTPPVDSGWVGLYVITLNYGQLQVSASDIRPHPTAPFIAFKLNTLTPGFSRMATYNSSGSFTVPLGSTVLKVRLCGGGGGGGAGASQLGGGGGGSGGYAEGVVAVQPGQVIPITVGGGGTGAVAGGVGAETGGTSAFGSVISATGGQGGSTAAPFAYGGSPGYGVGAAISMSGGYGSDGNGGTYVFTGNGGASFFGGGGRAAASGGAPEQAGLARGSGGGGCYGVPGNGGNGAPGVVIVEF